MLIRENDYKERGQNFFIGLNMCGSVFHGLQGLRDTRGTQFFGKNAIYKLLLAGV